MRYKCNSALNQVGVVLGSKLNPQKFSILSILGRDDIGQEVVFWEKPAMMEDIKDIEYW